jgi:hypothetical protein
MKKVILTEFPDVKYMTIWEHCLRKGFPVFWWTFTLLKVKKNFFEDDSGLTFVLLKKYKGLYDTEDFFY